MTKPQVTPQKFVFGDGNSIHAINGYGEGIVEFPRFKVTIETDAYMTDKKKLQMELKEVFKEVLNYFD